MPISGRRGNVAVALGRLGRRSAMVSAVPDDAIGDAAIDSLRKAGVDTSRIVARRRPNGRLLPDAARRRERGLGHYDRAAACLPRCAATTGPRCSLVRNGCTFRASFPALGPELAEVGPCGRIAAARAAVVRVSFDGNYRGTLWAQWCTDPGAVLADYIAGADLLFGSHRDLSLVLGREFGGTRETRQHSAALAAFERFPQLGGDSLDGA
jgi:2-dehydro-3-deoxygluconokinase